MEDDPQVLRFRELYDKNEAKIASLFGATGQVIISAKPSQPDILDHVAAVAEPATDPAPASKKRKFDEDDYDDPVPLSADGTGGSSLETLLVTRNKKLSNDLTILRVITVCLSSDNRLRIRIWSLV